MDERLTREMQENAREVRELAAEVNRMTTLQTEALMAQREFFTAVRAALYEYADRGEGFAIEVLGRLEKDPWWGSRPEDV
jgi:hypothetical protein